MRNFDRTVKDLQQQIERRDKANLQLQDEISRSKDKIENLLKTIDELQTSESQVQLAARRADRALSEEKERVLKLEKDLEVWKSLRKEKMGSNRNTSDMRVAGNSADENGIEIPVRRSSISRQASLSKGFL